MTRAAITSGLLLALVACGGEPLGDDELVAISQAVEGGTPELVPDSVVMVADETSAYCSAVLVGPNTVLVAAYCMNVAASGTVDCPTWNEDAILNPPENAKVLPGSSLDLLLDDATLFDSVPTLPAVTAMELSPDDDCTNSAALLTLAEAVPEELATVSPVRQEQAVAVGESILVADFSGTDQPYDYPAPFNAAEAVVECLECGYHDVPSTFMTEPLLCHPFYGSPAFDSEGAVVAQYYGQLPSDDDPPVCLETAFADLASQSAWVKDRVYAIAQEAGLDPPQWAGGSAEEPSPPEPAPEPLPPPRSEGGCSIGAPAAPAPGWALLLSLLTLTATHRRSRATRH